MAKKASHFQTIRTEGALLPPDILRLVASLKVDGASPDAYHLPPGSKINESISHSWGVLLSHWKSFQEARQQLADSEETATKLTNERWLLPLFKELDYGRLTTEKSPVIDDRNYPIERFYHHTPIHLIGCKLPLDRRTRGARGAATASPYSMVQEFLNRSENHVWAFLSNGLQLRVLRDNISLSRQAFVEFDLEAMFEGEVYSDFALLWLVCHQSRVEAEKSADCWLEKWSKLAKDQGTRVLKELRTGVAHAISALGQGFIGHPKNDSLRQRLQTGTLSKDDFYRQLLRVVYRLLFLFVAEDRELLHPMNCSDDAKELYDKYYSTRRLRELSRKMRGSKHSDLWHSLSLVFASLSKSEGCCQLALTGLGSFLWRNESTPDLLGPQQFETPSFITNDDLLLAIRSLAYIEQDRVLRFVDYRNLGSEEFGSVYESLLELHPIMHVEAKSFTLDTAAGNERKTTGSYYTPDSLVQCLLDSALEPVVTERLKEAMDFSKRGSTEVQIEEERSKGTLPRWYDTLVQANDSLHGNLKYAQIAEHALLAIKVCDPACGSGHFLIAAAHRLARHLARLRTGESQPGPEDFQHALRDVIGRCIYGVDINPMAVELCKVSLWIEAIEPGKPLSFLDHHIQCGNSLIGTTPALLRNGIPDEAFEQIEGDDKKVCSELKKQNKRERTDHKRGQHLLFEPPIKLGNLAAEYARLALGSDNSIDDIRTKEELYAKLVKGSNYLYVRLLADMWCAAFMWRKSDTELGRLCPTEYSFRRTESNPHGTNPQVKDEIILLANEFKFFHWHLGFPDVFQLELGAGHSGKSEELQASGTDTINPGWSGGFDIVLGNPPWEKVKVQEKEWFAGVRDDIAGASTAASRKSLIEKLFEEDAVLFDRFNRAIRSSEAISQFLRLSTRFPYCGVGDINTFAVFAELQRSLLGIAGYSGTVVPPGIATDETYKLFVQDLVDKKQLRTFFAFTNRGYLFPGVESTLSFCLLIVANTESSLFKIAAKLWSVEQIADVGRVYTLTPDEIKFINPNTKNLPIFETSKDAEIVKSLQRRFEILVQESPTRNDWLIQLSSMFHMTNDSGEFRTYEDMVEKGFRLVGSHLRFNGITMLPLYESKLMGQFDHRAATFSGIPTSDRFKTRARTNDPSLGDLANAEFTILPRYWIDSTSVKRKSNRNWHIGFRNAISAVADARSLIASVVPESGVGNSLPLISTNHKHTHASTFLLGYLNSFVADYLIRQKASGGNLNFYILKQLPITSPSILTEPLPFNALSNYGTWIDRRVVELSYTSFDLQSFALQSGCDCPPFRWDDERRFLMRCELDAAYFNLYLGPIQEWGMDQRSMSPTHDLKVDVSNSQLTKMFPTPRDAIDYIMETFPIIKRRDIERSEVRDENGSVVKAGHYVTKDTILSIYDEMVVSIQTGQPYQTRLTPPPGPPADANCNYLPVSDWNEKDWPTHIHKPRAGAV